jgi:hypothetical protein
MIGIGLENESEPLDVLNDTSIEITLENPILGDTNRLTPGSYSLPFGLPGGESSPKNSRQLSHPDVMENVQQLLPKQAILKFDDVPFKKGNIKIDSIEAGRIETYFLFGLGTLKDDIKTKRIRELVDETIVINDAPFTKSVLVIVNKNDEQVSVTVNGNSYQTTVDENDQPLTIHQQIVNASAQGGDVVMSVLDPSTPETVDGYYGMIITRGIKGGSSYTPSTDPLIELAVSVSEGPREEGTPNYWFYIGYNLDDYYADLNAGLLPHFNETAEDKRFVFPYHINFGMHGLEDVHYSTNVNLFSGTSVQFVSETKKINSTLYPGVPLTLRDNTRMHSLRPFLKTQYILDKILEFLEADIEGDFYSFCEGMLLDNSFTLDVLQDFVPYVYRTQAKTYNKLIFYRGSFNLSELVPDITVIDFLKAFAVRYNLAVYQNEHTGKLVMQFREPLAKSRNYQSIDLIAGRKGKATNNQLTGYRLLIKKEDADGSLSEEEAFEIGIPEHEIEIPLGRITNEATTQTSVGTRSGILVGRLAGAKLSIPRIFWYRGLHVDNYPYATINKGSGVNENITYIHNTYYKYWLLYYKNKRSLSLMVNWTLRELLKFDWTLKRRFDRSDFLVKSIKLRLTNRGLQVSETELITQR